MPRSEFSKELLPVFSQRAAPHQRCAQLTGSGVSQQSNLLPVGSWNPSEFIRIVAAALRPPTVAAIIINDANDLCRDAREVFADLGEVLVECRTAREWFAALLVLARPGDAFVIVIIHTILAIVVVLGIVLCIVEAEEVGRSTRGL